MRHQPSGHKQNRLLRLARAALLTAAVVSVCALPGVARADIGSDLLTIILDAANSFFNVTSLTLSAFKNFVTPNDIQESPIVAASCGPGSNPETGLQGQVPEADRTSGRSRLGYSCNLQLVGQYKGEGAIAVDPSSGTCAYNATSYLNPLQLRSPGVQVIDVADPSQPYLSTTLTSPAMKYGTGESLRVNETRKLLGGVSVALIPSIEGGLFFDLYDISDCKHPKLLNAWHNTNLTMPALILGHEATFSPDGKTYWAAGNAGGPLAAIDVSDTAHPTVIWDGLTGLPASHGMSLSADGNRLYLASTFIGGVEIFDVSEVQARKPTPQIKLIGSVFWKGNPLGPFTNVQSPISGTITQHTIPVSYKGKPYLIVPDEAGALGIHVVDISDDTKPKEVARFNLDIMSKANEQVAQNDMFGAHKILGIPAVPYVHDVWTYNAHYCTVDRANDPTALACGFIESGIRVFDIRDFTKPKEIAYFNPPAQSPTHPFEGKGQGLQGSYHANLAALTPLTDLSADYCMSPPRFVGPDQLWVSCMDNGFMALKFTNNAYPLNQ
ncbi:LVIVD repeat-containing protein [Burkholderia cenocepacia]|uniref:LVIVD repeat-containing protein n=1 Tax=Burkholderia cenocepacia TaxID=95486 RepID=UPI002865CE28|nr:hypothetical protein [Burkholderia cenocepacia]MDR8052895.1 hypothetical protein [Burkholderia cenocepacia]